MNKENNIAPINEDLNIAKYETENIKNLIYTIRGKQVMLDSDVAMLYHYETKKINQTVKRNIERFPEKFCFQLNEDETENYGGRRYSILKLAITNKFHDRFIIIDNKELYHIGASLKDLGKKCFAINKMEDINFIKNIDSMIL